MSSVPGHSAGGEAIESVSTAAMQAAQDAETGAWLQELTSGSLPRTLPPGLDRGAFGAWQQAEGGGSEGGCRLKALHTPEWPVVACLELLLGLAPKDLWVWKQAEKNTTTG